MSRFDLPARATQYFFAVLRVQVRYQQTQAGEVDATRSQRIDQRRQAARGARDKNVRVASSSSRFDGNWRVFMTPW